MVISHSNASTLALDLQSSASLAIASPLMLLHFFLDGLGKSDTNIYLKLVEGLHHSGHHAQCLGSFHHGLHIFNAPKNSLTALIYYLHHRSTQSRKP
ncbi:hypothetical protein V6N11_033818 [Hibiscus sabdariffa]|uniref:Uncharacterized protein n=1 Tax=Hibiscus sabdariffa TaxID=183260 RepID=A0ABR2S170_9ROSI